MVPHFSLLVLCGMATLWPDVGAFYGTPCSHDSECNDPNAICSVESEVGCSQGYCACKSGYSPNNTFFDAVSCIPNIEIPLGGNCSFRLHETHAAHATCFNFKSTCTEAYNISGEACTYNYGKSCSRNRDCGSYMDFLVCENSKCECKPDYKFSSGSGECVRRTAGDPCQSDSECSGLNPSGLGSVVVVVSDDWGPDGPGPEFGPPPGVLCRSGKCDCAAGYELHTIAGMTFDGGQKVETSSYCFNTLVGSTFDNEVGTACDMYPQGESDTAVATCMANTICFLCPEDGTSNIWTGTCRRIAAAQPTTSTSSTSSPSQSRPPQPASPVVADSGGAAVSAERMPKWLLPPFLASVTMGYR